MPRETNVFIRRKETDAQKLARVAGWPAQYKLAEARYIAEKTPRHAEHLGDILRLLPGSKIVLMIRDDRDAALSRARRLGTFEEAATLWARRYRAALRHADSSHAARYEDLVRDTAAVLGGVCGYLGLPFDAAMLAYHRTRRLWLDSVRAPPRRGRRRSQAPSPRPSQLADQPAGFRRLGRLAERDDRPAEGDLQDRCRQDADPPRLCRRPRLVRPGAAPSAAAMRTSRVPMMDRLGFVLPNRASHATLN